MYFKLQEVEHPSGTDLASKFCDSIAGAIGNCLVQRNLPLVDIERLIGQHSHRTFRPKRYGPVRGPTQYSSVVKPHSPGQAGQAGLERYSRRNSSKQALLPSPQLAVRSAFCMFQAVEPSPPER
jgi:hypothetical protein